MCTNILKRLFIFVLVLMLLMNCFVSFVGAANDEKQGFVDYQINASINFNETIKVVLTDKNTGYYYNHFLYRTNDYTGNMSIPFGTYLIEAEVVSDSDNAALVYEIDYPKEDIVINNAKLAVPIPLTVNIFSEIDVSGPSHTVENPVSEQTPDGTVIGSTPDATIFDTQNETTAYIDNDISEPTDETNTPEESELLEGKEKQEKDSSLLFSTLFYIGVLLVILIVYWVLKRRGYSR